MATVATPVSTTSTAVVGIASTARSGAQTPATAKPVSTATVKSVAHARARTTVGGMRRATGAYPAGASPGPAIAGAFSDLAPNCWFMAPVDLYRYEISGAKHWACQER